MPQVRVVDDKYRRASLCQRHHFAAGESAQVDGTRHTTFGARHFRRHETRQMGRASSISGVGRLVSRGICGGRCLRLPRASDPVCPRCAQV